MAAPKPTLVLVPGAWHKPEAFAPMTSLLESAGYTCVGINLPSVGPDPIDSIEPDVQAIRAVVKAQIDQDRDVLVLAHSYGSVPMGEAVKGLDKASVRKDGGTGGVVHLVYCTAFAPTKGTSLMDVLGRKDLPWFKVSDDKKLVDPEDPGEVFYGDVDEELKASSIKALETFSYQCFYSKVSWEPWRDIPATYILCPADKAIPLECQKGMVGAANGKFKEETVEGSSHSPFLSQPDKTTKIVRRAAGETI
ncbi:hypothetical protein R6Q59_009908 [Mikania micrantha]